MKIPWDEKRIRSVLKWRWGRARDAEDIIQAGITRAWLEYDRNLDGSRPEREQRAFLVKRALQRCNDEYKRLSAKSAIELDFEPSVTDTIQLVELPCELNEIARLLSDGFSAPEIAYILQLNRSTVYRRIYKIRALLEGRQAQFNLIDFDSRLTEREQEYILLRMQGLTTREIAQKICKSLSRVNEIGLNLHAKYLARNDIELTKIIFVKFNSQEGYPGKYVEMNIVTLSACG